MLNLNFNPFPTLQTESLLLRQYHPTDVQSFYQLRTNPIICDALDKEPLKSIEEAKTFTDKFEDNVFNNNAIYWVICNKQSGVFLGDISFYKVDKDNHRAEIGYALFPEFHKQGIMESAMKLVLDYGFNQMNLHSIEALTNPLNIKSQNLLKKFKFVQEGFIKENFYFKGEFLDTCIYSLLSKNYNNK